MASAAKKAALVAALEAARIQNVNHFQTLQRQIDLLVRYITTE